jgi:hypothetical protein
MKKTKVTFEFEVIDNSDNKFDFANTVEALHFIYQGITKLPLINNCKFSNE